MKNPNSDVIYDLYTGGFIGQFTRLALLLDIFTPLASGPASAEHVGKACKANLDGIRALLDHLSSKGILDYQSDLQTYCLTSAAATFLVKGIKSYAGDWVLALSDPGLYKKMLETIRLGQSDGYTLLWAQDACLESYSSSRVEYSLELWKTVGFDVELKVQLEMLDLACGCGIKTLAFAHATETTRVTCVDSPPVLEVARDLAERLGVETRKTFIGADILTGDFGAERHDAALLGLITYILTPDQNRTVFQDAFQALKPGGTLAIDAIMSLPEPTEWASRVSLLMSTWNGGAAHSFEAYEAWLLRAGFSRVIQHNQQLLSAIK